MYILVRNHFRVGVCMRTIKVVYISKSSRQSGSRNVSVPCGAIGMYSD